MLYHGLSCALSMYPSHDVAQQDAPEAQAALVAALCCKMAVEARLAHLGAGAQAGGAVAATAVGCWCAAGAPCAPQPARPMCSALQVAAAAATGSSS